ncbi:hypothetical protein PIROE2DRAFT_15729 [Piromyces sp. E2]|nr:hypothetical protein PIROE2DRAFT_15729 [Piromyces sp. E2]|eukprot:OUM58902.1 hypothetical protein PIROE2DRAFT_15729 [Piromyces sp. E2]
MNLVRILSLFIIFCNIITKSFGAEKKIDVTTVNQLKNALNEKTNVIINIKNNIVVDDVDKLQLGNSIKKVTIKGVSPSTSKLSFSHYSGGIYFNQHVNEINISDITLDSSMTFFSNENILFNNVVIDDGEYFFNMTMINNNNITITNSRFNPPKVEKTYYMTLYQAYLYIDNTQFYGNKNLKNGMIHIKNEKNFLAYGKFHLNNVLLSGGYEARFFEINNVKEIIFANSEVKNALSRTNQSGNINFNKCNDIYVRDVNFHDNYSVTNGGSLYLYKVLVSRLDNLMFVNSTAYMTGGAIAFQTERIDHSDAIIKNVTVKDGYNYDSINSRGQVFSLNGYINIEIEDLYCENFKSYNSDGPLIFINGDVKMIMKNVYAKKIYGNGVGSLFINTVNTNDFQIHAQNITISDAYIKSYQNTAVFLWLMGGTFTGTNININNVGGDYTSIRISSISSISISSISISSSKSITKFVNLNVDGFETKESLPLILNDGYNNAQNTLEIQDSFITNVYSNGALILLQDTRGLMKNSTVIDILKQITY